LPAVYPFRYFVTSGGLMSYGPTLTTKTDARLATSIASSGEKPADLPVQALTNTNWSSTSRPPRRLASKCRRRRSPAPTR
jgi:hypothetical protein